MKPVKLEFSIFGFGGPECSVRLENGKLVYQFCTFPGNPDKLCEVLPTERKWKNFKKKLDDLDVWSWAQEYHNPGVCDGVQWSLEIDFGDQKIKSSGSNLFPGSKDFGMDETPEFKAFLHALKLLIGGLTL